MYDYSDYPTLSTDKLITRLAEVSTALANGNDQLSFAKAEEIRARRDAWQTYEGTATGRRDHVALSSVDQLTTLWETEAEVAALTEEKWLIVRLLENHAADH